ncbi:hypothetical protein SAMN04490186_4650 [Pseudomonas grimontii]|uniref:Diguanylate cyclase n=1 Tax=Pseudomonas grimontii TaxID=129847 RepID=A0A1H1HQT0_9PSED|nr:hypothetical protein [Pseudomonas grimontii]TWR66206.1 hypothetical protein FIV39_13475 [Pseudomonas grimontii]SDR27719.1 hypothetical protein SAMN04490186_4650 [Pseudomonas grimontii]
MSIDPPSQPDSDVYRTLLESTKAIPWRIDWQSMTFSYIGPQIEHGFSAVSNLLTLSLGVGTRIVKPDSPMLGFVEDVDTLLYQAKRNGRMRAEFADGEV